MHFSNDSLGRINEDIQTSPGPADELPPTDLVLPVNDGLSETDDLVPTAPPPEILANRGILRFPGTDVGNSERFLNAHRRILRHCSTSNRWLLWGGSRWTVASSGDIIYLAQRTARALLEFADRLPNVSERERWRKFAARSESESRIVATINMAKADPRISITDSQLDSDPWSLNCANGTLNLKSGRLRKHRPSDLHSKLSPVEYDPIALCPTFDRFVHWCFRGNAELVSYVQRCIGYALTGDVSEKAMFFFYGDGDNGKTTFLEAIRHVLGDYAGQVPVDTLMNKRRGGIPNDIAQLKGLRFVTSSETEEGEALAESRIKYLTGMGTLQARFLYGELFQFPATFKLFIDGNHKPIVRGSDKAIWRRVKLIPFTATIAEGERDPHLLSKLKAEAAGILAWAIHGCREWQRRGGLDEPLAVRLATDEYRNEMDVLGDFVAQKFAVGPDLWIESKTVYEAYSEWAKSVGEYPVSQKRLTQKLHAQFGVTSARQNGARILRGIAKQ